MAAELFDRRLRALRRDRAARLGPEMVLFDRAFEDAMERIASIGRRFGRTLLIGCPSAGWIEQLRPLAGDIDVVDPGALFARSTGGIQGDEDRFDYGEERYDLAIAAGTLDTVNELPFALHLILRSLKPGAPLIGALAGGNSLAALRAAMIEADRSEGRVVARAHPRIEPAALAGLLTAAGFAMPVVDVDRVALRYSSLDALIRDLRGMAATSVLAKRGPLITRAWLDRVRAAFASASADGRTEEQVEILHFLGWNE